MRKKTAERRVGDKPETEVEVGGEGLLGGFFQGLSKLIDLADKVSREGGVIEKSGGFGIKGHKDLNGVYGFSIRTMTGPGGISRPTVQPFGDLAKVKKQTQPKGPIVEEAREPLVDLFDEGNYIRLVTELPGAAETEIVAEVQGDDVVQISTTGRKKYSKEVLLSAKVDPKSVTRSYANGVLELRLQKAK